MPRYPHYERQITRTDQENQFWDNPANVLGLARQAGDRVERSQQHALANELAQQRIDQQQAEYDRKFAQHQIDTDVKNRKDTEAIGAFAEISDLNPADPDFRLKVAGVTQRYPLGMLDRGVQSLLKDYHSAADKSVAAIRAAHNLDETVDPRTVTTIDPQTGVVSYDHDKLNAIGKAQAMRRSQDLADINATQAGEYINNGATQVTMGPKGNTALIKPDDGKADAALAKDQFKAAQSRREKALGLLMGGGFKDANQKAMAQKEYEAANSEYGKAHEQMFGEPFVSQLPAKPLTSANVPSDTVGAAVGVLPAVKAAAIPDGSAASTPATSSPATASPAQTPATVRVKNKDGVIGRIPAAQLPDAIKTGEYTPLD